MSRIRTSVKRRMTSPIVVSHESYAGPMLDRGLAAPFDSVGLERDSVAYFPLL